MNLYAVMISKLVCFITSKKIKFPFPSVSSFSKIAFLYFATQI